MGRVSQEQNPTHLEPPHFPSASAALGRAEGHHCLQVRPVIEVTASLRQGC